MYQKLTLLILLMVAITTTKAASVFNESAVGSDPVEPKIETIDQYAFLVLDLGKYSVVPHYGETVELVFTGNKRIKLYNLSGKEIKYFKDSDGKLIAFITPENLRFFQSETLKKVIFNQDGKREVFKVSLPVDELLTKD